jgi:hypothetical protein
MAWWSVQGAHEHNEHEGESHMRHLWALSVLALLAGCASTYRQEVVTAAQARLERGKPVLIATPKNGAYNRTEYPQSGRQTAAAVHTAFARYADGAAISTRCKDLECLQAEGGTRYAYLVVPEILHWEDRATEWSGIPDRMEVKITVWDVQRNAVVSSGVLSGKSKWATLGGDHPQDLLPEPVNGFVATLY